MKTYKFVEVPLIGYVLTENPWTFGYKELFNKEYNVEVYLSEESKRKTLEDLVSSEAKKGKIKTLAYGIGTAGTAATASSAIASILGLVCSGGACPLWLGAMFSTLTPFAWAPIIATGGFVIAKRLGGRKGLQYIEKSLPKEIKTLDYTPITDLIKNQDLENKILEYYLLKMSGTRKEKLKRLFKQDTNIKLLKKELEKGFGKLADTSYEMFQQSKEEKEQYRAINKTYDYIRKGFSGRILRTKNYLIFGI
ncbi:MAG: hypothetical protein Q8O03_09395 [Nanoarchaeota archaeon]|nr:hypothetical protein [Nanoarchaeota archaeon]